MILKNNKKEDEKINFDKIKPSKVFTFIAGLCFCFLLFFAGLVFQKKNLYVKHIKGGLELQIERISGFLANLDHELPELSLDIKHKHFQKLSYKRYKALQIQQLIKDGDDFVPVKLNYKNKAMKGKMRLKGDLVDHFRTKKWSFRVKIKSDDTFEGMKLFSLQSPYTRGYLNEWVFHKMLKHIEVLGLRYFFIRLKVNGEDRGIYAVEEHFEKRLLEGQKKLEGPILKYDETAQWEDSRISMEQGRELKTSQSHFNSTLVKAFGMGAMKKNPSQMVQFERAKNLLMGFRSGQLGLEQVFDIDKLARIFAIAQVLGGHEHITDNRNLRFYYNPVTGLVEPIGYDSNSGELLTDLLGSYDFDKKEIRGNQFNKQVFKNKSFKMLYLNYLTNYSKKDFLDDFFQKIEKDLKVNNDVLAAFYPLASKRGEILKKEVYYKNQEYIQAAILPKYKLYSYLAEKDKNIVKLKVRVIQGFPIDLLKVRVGSNTYVPSHKLTLYPNDDEEKLYSFHLKGEYKAGSNEQIQLDYKPWGSEDIFHEQPLPWRGLASSKINEHFASRKSLHQMLKKKNDSFVIKKGIYKLTEDLIVPKGSKLFIEAGTQIKLGESVKFISYSPVYFQGEEKSPIVLSGSERSQGFAVINAKEKSVIEHTHFIRLSNPKDIDWSLSGSVTFYNSPVYLSYVNIDTNYCEDALNIKNTHFYLNHVEISNTKSDAFDSDFSSGKLNHISFSHIGNDAIDTSGSKIEAKNIAIEGVGDKGLSFGEGSFAQVFDVSIRDAEIGVAAKDTSFVKIKNLDLTDVNAGFTVFRKKPEFTGAQVKVSNLSHRGVKVMNLVEKQSELIVNGRSLAHAKGKVKQMLYGIMFGKKTEKSSPVVNE